VELRGLEPLTPCLQNRPRLSETVAHLGMKSRARPLRSDGVGSCCGQAWWSAFITWRRRSFDPWLVAARSAKVFALSLTAVGPRTRMDSTTSPDAPRPWTRLEHIFALGLAAQLYGRRRGDQKTADCRSGRVVHRWPTAGSAGVLESLGSLRDLALVCG
jgi:hypothetical protein